MKDAAVRIEGLIRDYVRNSPDNSLKSDAEEKAWAEPLVGYARGDDPLFLFYKSDIGAFFWTPPEIFSIKFRDWKPAPEELTVISWVLPQTEATKAENRRQKDVPAERWVRSRNYGEAFNVKLAGYLVGALREGGIDSVAPAQFPQWAWQTSERYGFSSNWSERHAAHAAGLGTFGLCDGLITPKGKAMRCGSVVARVTIPPTPRPYGDYRAYCLFYSRGICRKCISRCPTGAISEAGHDKSRCRDFLFETIAPWTKSRFGIESYGCGLCQTRVPCESRIPAEEDGQ
jgi:epoxyqueuosine reductase